MGDIDPVEAIAKLERFDAWVEAIVRIDDIGADDFLQATERVRRFDLALRTPDALHIAIASRLQIPIFTFDVKMTAAAQAVGCVVLI